MGSIAVTGSVAYDTIMVFGGRFADHILSDQAHILNVSFLVDRLEKRRGGVRRPGGATGRCRRRHLARHRSRLSRYC